MRSGSTLRAGVALAAFAAVLVVARPANAALPLEPHDCGDTIKHSMRLKNDLTGCPSSGLVAGKDGITIDLNGHRVEGGGLSTFGIDNSNGFDDVKVRNGIIRFFSVGVKIGADAEQNRITKLVIKSDTNAVSAEGTGHVVKKNVASGNLTAISLAGGGAHQVRSNVVSGNGSDGIFVSGTTGSVITSNHVSQNTGSGITVTGPGSHTIVGNRSLGNGSLGINVAAAASEVRGNTVTGNSLDGMWLGGGNHAIEANTITANADDGIEVQSGAPSLIGNVLSGNGYPATPGSGLGLNGNVSTTGTDNVARGNDDSNECNPTAACDAPAPVDPSLPVITPICGTPVTTSGRLDANLVCAANTDGLVVGADGITLDLGGHSIVGDKDLNRAGVDVGTHNGVTVRNGVVRGFDDGVRSDQASKAARLLGLVSVDNAEDGFELAGAGHILKRNRAIANDAVGIFLSGVTTPSAPHNVRSNDASRNAIGMLVDHGKKFTVAKNVFAANFVYGVGVSSGSSHEFIGNVVAANENDGVQFLATPTGHVLRGNTVTGNDGDGIHLGTGGYTLERNKVFGNDDHGVDGDSVTAKTVAVENAAHGNGYGDALPGQGLGIDLDPAHAAGGANKARGNDNPLECVPASLC